MLALLAIIEKVYGDLWVLDLEVQIRTDFFRPFDQHDNFSHISRRSHEQRRFYMTSKT